jgi:acyl-coenzyme A synthetase/AMP-(fatty) acid ligase
VQLCIKFTGALTGKPVLDFLRKCFRCVVYDGYGTTETGGIANDNVINPGVGMLLSTNK